MRWGQIQDDKGRRAVCMHEETIYELPQNSHPYSSSTAVTAPISATLPTR